LSPIGKTGNGEGTAEGQSLVDNKYPRTLETPDGTILLRANTVDDHGNIYSEEALRQAQSLVSKEITQQMGVPKELLGEGYPTPAERIRIRLKAR